MRPTGEGELWVQLPRDETWPHARHNHAFVCVLGARLLLHGGAKHGLLNKATKRFEQVYCQDMWTFDVTKGSWQEVAASREGPCGRHQVYFCLFVTCLCHAPSQHTLVDISANGSALVS
jgi:hypothetical protein